MIIYFKFKLFELELSSLVEQSNAKLAKTAKITRLKVPDDGEDVGRECTTTN
jgi:hypothetical protein